MENFSSEFLPEEIYIKIFSTLSSKDLQSLTLTCKHFYKIISNSLKLLKMYEITINSDSVHNFEHLSDRKYSKFKIIGEVDKEILENIFEKFANSIQIVHFDQMKIKADKFVKIMNFCDNLKQISFTKFELLDENENNLQVKKFGIKNFTLILSDLNVLKIFKNSRIKNLFIRDSKSCNWTVINDVKNFENLTIFKPESSRFVSNFSNINIPSVKKLRLMNINFKESSIPFNCESLNLNELILEYVNNCADFLTLMLQKDTTKLKLLRSIGIAYDGITCWIVRKNRHKIEKLESNFKIPMNKPVAFGNASMFTSIKDDW